MSTAHDLPDSPAGPFRVADPRSIRALAHPARLAIIDALSTGEQLTATQCAQLTGLSPSATAYHLKFLERFGYAQAAPPRPDRRERPWRAVDRKIQVEVDVSTPASASAAVAVAAAYFDSTRAIGLDFVAAGPDEPAPWREEAVLANADLWLTAEELQQLAEELDAVLKPYRGRQSAPDRPEGSRRVRAMNVLVPYRQTSPHTDRHDT